MDCMAAGGQNRPYESPLFGHLPAGLAGQIPGFRNQVNRFENLRIAVEQDASGFGHAELVVEDFVPDQAFDEFAVRLKLLFRELNSAFRDVLLELGKNRIANLEGLVDAGVLGTEIAHEREEG